MFSLILILLFLLRQNRMSFFTCCMFRLESEKETGSVAEGEVYVQLANHFPNDPLKAQVSFGREPSLVCCINVQRNVNDSPVWPNIFPIVI